MMIFEDLVKKNFEGLSPGQKKVATYFLENKEQASYDTIAKIAREVGISETTVIRLSYALGFNGFSEMQKSLQLEILKNSTQQEPPKELEEAEECNPYLQIIEQDIHNLKQMQRHLDIQEVEKVIQSLIQADKVVVVGARTSHAAANWFALTLGFLREDVRLASTNAFKYDELLSVTENTVVFSIFFPRYSKETYQYAKTAKEQGATLITVTDNKFSVLGSISDVTLLTNSYRDEIGFNSISSVISLLNLIIVGFRKKEHEQVKSRLQKLEEFYSGFEIFFE